MRYPTRCAPAMEFCIDDHVRVEGLGEGFGDWTHILELRDSCAVVASDHGEQEVPIINLILVSPACRRVRSNACRRGAAEHMRESSLQGSHSKQSKPSAATSAAGPRSASEWLNQGLKLLNSRWHVYCLQCGRLSRGRPLCCAACYSGKKWHNLHCDEWHDSRGADRRDIGAEEHMQRRVADDGKAYTKSEFITHYGMMTGEKRWEEAVDQAEVWTRETFEMVKRMARSARKKTGGAAEHVEEQCLRGSPSNLRRPPRSPESQQ